jgi:ADP-heptose:LPS heptosyltransferase
MNKPRSSLMTLRHRALEMLLRSAMRGGPVSLSQEPLSPPPRKLLVVKVSGLGDGLLVRSVIGHWQQVSPGMELGVLVCPPTREALSSNSNFRVHCYDPRRDSVVTFLRLVRQVRRVRYDAAVDFEPYSLLTALFMRLSGIPSRIGFAGLPGNPRAVLLTNAIELLRSGPLWNNFVRLARMAAPLPGGELSTLPLPCAAEDERWLNSWLQERGCKPGTRLVALHLGVHARTNYKAWPLARFVSLAEHLKAAVPGLILVLTGTAAERELIQQFRSEFSGKAIDAGGIGALGRTAMLLSRCDLLVSSDTGVMHLGACMGVPTVGIFGATRTDHWAPVGPHATFVYATQVQCSPCVDVLRQIAPIECVNAEKSRCMWDVGVDRVLQAAREVVAGDWLSQRDSGLMTQMPA